MTDINLTQLRAAINTIAEDDPDFQFAETVLALIDTAEAATETITNWEGCQDEGSCWHMAKQHLHRLRDSLNRYTT